MKTRKDLFAERVVRELRRTDDRSAVRYDPRAFALVAERGPNRATLFLSGAYRRYRIATASQRRADLARLVQSWRQATVGLPVTFAEARPRLLPYVINRGVCEAYEVGLRAVGQTAGDGLLTMLTEELLVGVGCDFPDSVFHLERDHLAGWGVAPEEARAAALDNLRRASERPFREVEPGLWESPRVDDYDAARLLLTDLLRRCRVRGDLVAMAPDRNRVFLTGTEDSDGLTALARRNGPGVRHPNPLSRVAYRLAGDTWVPFLPVPEHPAYLPLLRMAQETVAAAYAAHAEPLQQLLAAGGERVFVATLMTNPRDPGWGTMCTWTEGVDAVLPRADRVGFTRQMGAEPQIVLGDWDRVRAVVGGLMEPVAVYPERYRVRAFPSPDELRDMCEGGGAPRRPGGPITVRLKRPRPAGDH